MCYGGTNKFSRSLSLHLDWILGPIRFRFVCTIFRRRLSSLPRSFTRHVSSKNLVLKTFIQTDAIVTESNGSTAPNHFFSTFPFSLTTSLSSPVAIINRYLNFIQACLEISTSLLQYSNISFLKSNMSFSLSVNHFQIMIKWVWKCRLSRQRNSQSKGRVSLHDRTCSALYVAITNSEGIDWIFPEVMFSYPVLYQNKTVCKTRQKNIVYPTFSLVPV